MAFLVRFWKSSNEAKKDEFRRKVGLAEPQPDDTCVLCYDEDEPTVRTCISPCTHAVCLLCLDGGLLAYNINICPICQKLWYGYKPKKSIDERIMEFSDAHPTVERILLYVFDWGNLTLFIASLLTTILFCILDRQESRGIIAYAAFCAAVSGNAYWSDLQRRQELWPIFQAVDAWLAKRIWRWLLAGLFAAIAHTLRSVHNGERARSIDLFSELWVYGTAINYCCLQIIRRRWPNCKIVRLLYPDG